MFAVDRGARDSIVSGVNILSNGILLSPLLLGLAAR
jgi:predicted ribosome-associated RNA-binding protein Tma20